MATEILVNDGGAPARILPFTAGSAVTGGRLVAIASDGKVDHAASGATNALGVAFTDAGSADGEAMSVITGKGVILNVSCSGTFDIGQALTVENAGTGLLTSGTSNLYAVALHAGSSTASTGSLGKVLMY